MTNGASVADDSRHRANGAVMDSRSHRASKAVLALRHVATNRGSSLKRSAL